MKVKYIAQPKVYEYEPNKNFTFGTEYKVLADYRQRRSGQQAADNGFVVVDNQGCENMLFSNQVKIIEDGEKCFIFNYKEEEY